MTCALRPSLPQQVILRDREACSLVRGHLKREPSQVQGMALLLCGPAWGSEHIWDKTARPLT
jgi:hypothetical protein